MQGAKEKRRSDRRFQLVFFGHEDRPSFFPEFFSPEFISGLWANAPRTEDVLMAIGRRRKRRLHLALLRGAVNLDKSELGCYLILRLSDRIVSGSASTSPVSSPMQK